MNFKAHYLTMPVPERTEFAVTCGTTHTYLKQVAYGVKRLDLGLADVIVAVSRGKLTLDDLPLTDNARRQRGIREKHDRRWRRFPGTASAPATEAAARQPEATA